MKKLSIIVPIYGVEQYLHKCVDSLLDQDIPSLDYEIILVDDGSPDACPQICDEYARMNETIVRDRSRIELENEGVREFGKPFIKVIHREKNGGLSAARNSGIGVAQGEYVMFVDSDDYIEPNVLNGLLEQMDSEKLDVLRYRYQNVRIVEGVYEIFQPYKYPHPVDLQNEIVNGETYLNERLWYACYVTQFIVRRALLIDDKCLFTEGIHFEDVDWVPRIMLKAERVNSCSTIVYNYLMRCGSITQTGGNIDKLRKNVEDNLYVIYALSELKEQNPFSLWLSRMRSLTVANVLTMIATNLYRERRCYIKYLSELGVFPLDIADQGITYRRRAKLINILGANIYCMMMHMRALCKV